MSIAVEALFERICSLCQKTIKANNVGALEKLFFRDKSKKYGFSTICKDCDKKKTRKRINRGYLDRQKHPEKYQARFMLRGAIKSGKIKPGKCRDCSETKVHGHHPDYSKPLDVIWLCVKHHVLEHRKMKSVGAL